MNSDGISTRDPYQISNSLRSTPNGLIKTETKKKYQGGLRMKRSMFSVTKVFILKDNADSKNICQSQPVVMAIAATCYSYTLSVFHTVKIA